MSDTTATAPAAPVRDPFDAVLPTEARHTILAQGDALRRLADELDSAPDETTLDLFIALDQLKKQAKAISDKAQKMIGDRESGLMGALLEEFAEEGVSSKRHSKSGRLAHINTRVFAKALAEKSEVAIVMRDVDEMSDFVEFGFNLQTVSSWFSERKKGLEEAGTPVTEDALRALIPEQLRGLLDVTLSPVISTRA